MSAAAFLGRLAGILEGVGVDYMVTGSFASTHYGEPRSTQDLDLVVRLDQTGLERLLAVLPEEDWYVSPEAARDAIRRRRQFNLICQQTGWKVDLIVQKDDAFARAEFERRRREEVLGQQVWLVSPEDVVIAKLRWARAGGGSQRQFRDVVSMLRLIGPTLDQHWIDEWIEKLGLKAEWAEVLGLLA